MTDKHLAESLKAGLRNGWDAANFAEAYGSSETREAEASRRAAEQSTYDVDGWEAGFLQGWELHDEGKWQDGTPRDDETNEVIDLLKPVGDGGAVAGTYTATGDGFGA